jgi:hypothetical protein
MGTEEECWRKLKVALILLNKFLVSNIFGREGGGNTQLLDERICMYSDN